MAQGELFIVSHMGEMDTFVKMETAARKWFQLNRTSDDKEIQYTYISCKRSEGGAEVLVTYKRSWINRAGASSKPERVTDDPTTDATSIIISTIDPEIETLEKLPVAPTAAPNPASPVAQPVSNSPPVSEKFSDSQLEAEYERYLARKKSEKKTPKNRADWKVAREYWLKDSPLARGNAFNAKAQQGRWYEYFEINLENGKRLDSYVPPLNGKTGEIISRKATSLEEIELSTFESYLKEMHKKYAAGTKVRSNKYPALDGKPLQGQQILEIPDSNQSFKDIKAYTDLAKSKYNIELRFRPE